MHAGGDDRQARAKYFTTVVIAMSNTTRRLAEHAREAELDPPAAHRHAFAAQQLGLPSAFRQASVGPYDPVPGQVLPRRRQHQADQARRRRIDVSVGAHESLWNRPDRVDDPRPAQLHYAGEPASAGTRGPVSC